MAEVVTDNGREMWRDLEIEGTLDSGQKLPRAPVPIAKFAAMNWPLELWGHHAAVAAGMNSKDRLREAIQLLSQNVGERHVYAHTGWARVGTAWAYLHAGGAVGAEGVEVSLPSELRAYTLPSVAEDPRGAMKTSLALLDIAPLTVTGPLWAAVWRAVLASALPADFSLFLAGPTGALKSTLAALFLSHFGAFGRVHLPGSWASTANALEHRAFTLKDSLFVIDDYAPQQLDAKELQAKANRLLRAQGNLAGRGRLKSNLEERATYPPRGLIISTGEDLPRGESILARTVIVRLERESVDMKKLTELQALAHRLPHTMLGFLQLVAPEIDTLSSRLAEIFSGARDRLQSDGAHLRTPEANAQLWVGAVVGLQFAIKVGALSGGEADALRASLWVALREVADEQTQQVQSEQPVRQWLGLLLTLFQQRRVFVLPKGDSPSEPRPGVEFIGWADGDHVLVLPDAAMQAVAKFTRESGQPCHVGRDTLLRALKREKLSVCDERRTLHNLKFGDHQRRVLCLNVEAVGEFLGESFARAVATSRLPLGGEERL
jgi:hypothetical protein